MDKAIPAYINVMQQIKRDIVSGKLEPNQKLDSIKQLSEKYNINPNTMQKALAILEKEGLLRSRRTAGKYITDNNLIKICNQQYLLVNNKKVGDKYGIYINRNNSSICNDL